MQAIFYSMTSSAHFSKRAFVKLLMTMAAMYGLNLGVSRSSPDAEVTRAYRQAMKKIHPDKGGNPQHAQQINNAKDVWDQAQADKGRPGRPTNEPEGGARPQNNPGNPRKRTQGGVARSAVRPGAEPEPNPSADARGEIADPEEVRRTYRIQSLGVMLTYNGIQDLAQWRRFLAFVAAKKKGWGVKHWCATLERCETSGRLHIHLYVQFFSMRNRSSGPFAFEGIRPRADPNDYLGEGINKRCVQKSIDRGFFYVWADKVGTERDEHGAPCVSGNYAPCWTKERFRYQVHGRWPENLWKARKLSTAVYDDYLFLCRDGVIGRKKNLDACVEREEKKERDQEIQARVKRIRANPNLYVPFPEVPEAQRWLKSFQTDAIRYPILVALGPSFSGKTEWAKSLFQNPLTVEIGKLENFPEKFREFDKKKFDGIVCDDVRDLEWVSSHQEKLQGSYERVVEFGSTPGGQCAYFRDMYCVPLVITINWSTGNLGYLDSHDWLAKPENRVIVTFPLPGFAPPPRGAA